MASGKYSQTVTEAIMFYMLHYAERGRIHKNQEANLSERGCDVNLNLF